MSDETLQDQIQLLTNTNAMLGNLMAATTHALNLSKQALEGVDPNVVKGSGPEAAIVKIALEALDKGREAAIACMILSEKSVQLKTRIQGIYADRQLRGLAVAFEATEGEAPKE